MIILRCCFFSLTHHDQKEALTEAVLYIHKQLKKSFLVRHKKTNECLFCKGESEVAYSRRPEGICT